MEGKGCGRISDSPVGLQQVGALVGIRAQRCQLWYHGSGPQGDHAAMQLRGGQAASHEGAALLPEVRKSLPAQLSPHFFHEGLQRSADVPRSD